MRDFLILILGGGGGNRTRVREDSTQSLYRFRSGLEFNALLAPDRAFAHEFSLKSRAYGRKTDHTRQPHDLSPAWAYEASAHVTWLSTKQPERSRNRWQLLFVPLFTRPAAPRPATLVSISPSKPGHPPATKRRTACQNLLFAFVCLLLYANRHVRCAAILREQYTFFD